MTTVLNLLRTALGNGYCFVASHLISPLSCTQPVPSTTLVAVSETDPSFKCRLILNLALRDSGFGTSMTAFMSPSHIRSNSLGSSSAITGIARRRTTAIARKNVVILLLQHDVHGPAGRHAFAIAIEGRAILCPASSHLILRRFYL